MMDVFVFAPLGFALEARELIPKMVERGRQHAAMARVVGQFAVEQGQKEAGRRIEQVRHTTESLTERRPTAAKRPAASATTAASSTKRPAAPASSPAAEERIPVRRDSAPERHTDGDTGTDTETLTGAGATPTGGPPTLTVVPSPDAVPSAGKVEAVLGIPDYDSLSASQVVPRLAGLSPGELEAVRAYETANRGRRTVLSKIAQLQAR
jgi:hypothetical protein